MLNQVRELRRHHIEMRIVEDPSLYGLLVRERGEPVEYVSYREAARRRSQRPCGLGESVSTRDHHPSLSPRWQECPAEAGLAKADSD